MQVVVDIIDDKFIYFMPVTNGINSIAKRIYFKLDKLNNPISILIFFDM